MPRRKAAAPQQGAKPERAAKLAVAPAAAPAVLPSHDCHAPPLTAAERENPNRLSGEALRSLAHRRGIARSELSSMSDEKIREQMRYRVHAQYESESA